jgi:hypothetical protein
LPDQAIIAEARKIADMIRISSHSLCGEDNFRCARLKKPGYRWEGPEFFRPGSIDIDWIWEVFGSVITVGL